jgi:copper ion binding protein
MGLRSVTIPVRGMTCDACVRAIERKLSRSPGVSSAHVELAGGTATVEFDPDRIQLPDLVQAVEKLGYTVQK